MITRNRLGRLDAVRALGVLLVIAYHTSYRFEPAHADLIGRTMRVIGWVGVDLFFALSGFLVGKILADERKRSDIGLFARKRFFRIVPIFVVAVATFALGDWLIAGGANLANMWKPLMFLTGYMLPFQGEALVPYTITWSLSVEVSAYVMLGLLAWLSWNRFRQALWAIVIVSLPLRIWLSVGLGWDEAMVGVFPPARLDAISLGALVALGCFDRLLDWRHAALGYGLTTIAIMIGFRFAVWYPPFIATFGYLLFALAAALWVGALARIDRENSPFTKAAAHVGLVSYFMYLFHLFFIEGFLLVSNTFAWGSGFWLAFLIASGATYLAGVLSWRYFESPLNRIGGRRKDVAWPVDENSVRP